jgi:hypothetical protein
MVCLAAATRVAARRTRAVAKHHDLTTRIIAGYTPEARSIYEAETLPSQEVEVSCVQRYIAPAYGVVATKAEIESPPSAPVTVSTPATPSSSHSAAGGGAQTDRARAQSVPKRRSTALTAGVAKYSASVLRLM